MKCSKSTALLAGFTALLSANAFAAEPPAEEPAWLHADAEVLELTDYKSTSPQAA